LKGIFAFFTFLPLTLMLFIMMVGAESISMMISIATRGCIGKKNILMGVIADPIITARGFS
jgi:hypothetical protein